MTNSMTGRWLLCATTAMALMATPALAADDSAQGTHSPKATAPSAEQAIDRALNDRDASPSSSEHSMDNSADSDGDRPQGHDRAMAQRRLRTALKDAGFTDVRILGTTYRIRARDEDGNTVFMSINPPSTGRHAMHGKGMGMGMGMGMGRSMGRGPMVRGPMEGSPMEGSPMEGGPGSMERSSMDQEPMNGAETAGAGKSDRGYGAEASGTPGDDYAEGHGGNGPRGEVGTNAYDRAYDQGFRDGYNRGFDGAQGWR